MAQAVALKRNPSSDANIGVHFMQPSQERNRGMPIAIVRGCPHNKCRFCGFYKNPDGDQRQRFTIRPLAEVKQDIVASRELAKKVLGINSHDGRIRGVFLGDGDALAAPVNYLTDLLGFMRANLPDLERVNAYARVRSILNKRNSLGKLRESGLSGVYVGFESGSDEILAVNHKGVTVSDNLSAARMATAGGIKVHAMVVSGLGGAERSAEHAEKTADMLNAMTPETIMISRLYPPYPAEKYTNTLGVPFTMLSDEQQVLEDIAIVRRLAADMRIYLGGFACCMEYLEADTRAGMIGKLEGILARVRNGEHLIHIAGDAGPN